MYVIDDLLNILFVFSSSHRVYFSLVLDLDLGWTSINVHFFALVLSSLLSAVKYGFLLQGYVDSRCNFISLFQMFSLVFTDSAFVFMLLITFQEIETMGKSMLFHIFSQQILKKKPEVNYSEVFLLNMSRYIFWFFI